MVYINVKVHGHKELLQTINRIEKKSGKISDRLASEFASEVKRIVKRKMMINRWSGEMEKLYKRKLRNGNYIIESGASHAIYQELGFAPHWVKTSRIASKGKTIADYLKSKGFRKVPKVIFVKKPYSKSYYIVPAILEAEQKFPKIASQIINEEVKL